MNLRGKIGGALAALGLAAGLSLAWAGSAGADAIPPNGQWAEIYNPYLHAQNITLCVDDPGGSMYVGTQLDLWRCHGYASNGGMQRWVFAQVVDDRGNPYLDNGSAVYVIYNPIVALCLTATSQLPPAPLTLGPCDANGGTWWELPTPNAPATTDFQIFPWPKTSTYNTCVSASNFTDSNGTRLVMEHCDRNDTSQLWNLG